MHGNKRAWYQSKLIYSHEDGVSTVLCEMNELSATSWPDSSASKAFSQLHLVYFHLNTY